MSEVVNPITKQELKDWLKALRSGEYKQGKGKLGDHIDGYCCLGVLNVTANVGCISSTGYLKEDKRNRFDVSITPLKLPVNVQGDLSSRNDKGVPFNVIADYIETLNLCGE